MEDRDKYKYITSDWSSAKESPSVSSSGVYHDIEFISELSEGIIIHVDYW